MTDRAREREIAENEGLRQKLREAEARAAKMEQERDRQYEENAGLIAKAARAEAAEDEANEEAQKYLAANAHLRGRLAALERRAEQAEREREGLREELVAQYRDTFFGLSYEGVRNSEPGWWDTMANSSAQYAGDKLVEMGLFERHPEGVGRRWWYREKPAALAPRAAAEATEGGGSNA